MALRFVLKIALCQNEDCIYIELILTLGFPSGDVSVALTERDELARRTRRFSALTCRKDPPELIQSFGADVPSGSYVF